MNESFEQKMKDLGATLSPTALEKAAMKTALLSRVRTVVPTLRTRHVSAYVFDGVRLSRTFAYLQSFSLVPVAVCAAIFLGGGISFSAERAVPGDVLYPIKVGVNEKVLELTAITPEAKARLQAELADRRLGEVEILAAESTLSPETSSVLQTAFEIHAAAAGKGISALKSSGDMAEAQRIASNLDSSISAHGQIMNILTRRNEKPAVVAAESRVAGVLPLAVAKKAVPTPAPMVEPATSSSKSASTNQLRTSVEGVRNLASSTIGEGVAIPTSTNSARTKKARELYQNGTNAYSKGKLKQAFELFQSSVREAEASKNSEDSIDASHKQGTTTPVSIRVRRKGERVKDSVNAAAVNAAVPVTHATRNEARDDNDE